MSRRPPDTRTDEQRAAARERKRRRRAGTPRQARERGSQATHATNGRAEHKRREGERAIERERRNL